MIVDSPPTVEERGKTMQHSLMDGHIEDRVRKYDVIGGKEMMSEKLAKR